MYYECTSLGVIGLAPAIPRCVLKKTIGKENKFRNEIVEVEAAVETDFLEEVAVNIDVSGETLLLQNGRSGPLGSKGLVIGSGSRFRSACPGYTIHQLGR